MVLVKSELYKEKVNGIFLSKTHYVLQSLKYIFWSTKCYISGAYAPWNPYGPQPTFLGTF